MKIKFESELRIKNLDDAILVYQEPPTAFNLSLRLIFAFVKNIKMSKKDGKFSYTGDLQMINFGNEFDKIVARRTLTLQQDPWKLDSFLLFVDLDKKKESILDRIKNFFNVV